MKYQSDTDLTSQLFVQQFGDCCSAESAGQHNQRKVGDGFLWQMNQCMSIKVSDTHSVLVRIPLCLLLSYLFVCCLLISSVLVFACLFHLHLINGLCLTHLLKQQMISKEKRHVYVSCLLDKTSDRVNNSNLKKLQYIDSQNFVVLSACLFAFLHAKSTF